MILFLREATGSFATAGLVAGSLALGAGLGAPFAARLVDRRGAVWLLPLAIAHAGAILTLWGLGEVDAPAAALVAIGLVAGSSFPPAGAVLRARWPELLGGDPTLIRGAYAFDSVTIELSFVSGPLIVGGARCAGRARGRPRGLVRRWWSRDAAVPVAATRPPPRASGERAHRAGSGRSAAPRSG